MKVRRSKKAKRILSNPKDARKISKILTQQKKKVAEHEPIKIKLDSGKVIKIKQI